MPGRAEAEQFGGEILVARVSGAGVNELLSVPQDQQGRQRVCGLVVLHVVVRDQRDGRIGDPQVVSGHEQVEVELDRQAKQFGLELVIDPRERLIERDHARARRLGG